MNEIESRRIVEFDWLFERLMLFIPHVQTHQKNALRIHMQDYIRQKKYRNFLDLDVANADIVMRYIREFVVELTNITEQEKGKAAMMEKVNQQLKHLFTPISSQSIEPFQQWESEIQLLNQYVEEKLQQIQVADPVTKHSANIKQSLMYHLLSENRHRSSTLAGVPEAFTDLLVNTIDQWIKQSPKQQRAWDRNRDSLRIQQAMEKEIAHMLQNIVVDEEKIRFLYQRFLSIDGQLPTDKWLGQFSLFLLEDVRQELESKGTTLLDNYFQWNSPDIFLGEFTSILGQNQNQWRALYEDRPQMSQIVEDVPNSFRLQHIFSPNELKEFRHDVNQWIWKQDRQPIEQWLATIMSVYQEQYQAMLTNKARHTYQTAYQAHYLRQYADLYHQGLQALFIDSKPQNLQDYPAFEEGKQHSDHYEGEYHYNVKMSIADTYLAYTLLQQCFDRFFKQCIQSCQLYLSDERKNQQIGVAIERLYQELDRLPNEVFLRFEKRKSKESVFDLRIWPEEIIYQYGTKAEMNMPNHLVDNVYTVMPGIPLKDIPDRPLSNPGIRLGIINLMKDAIQDHLDPELPVGYPKNYDPQACLRLFCNFTKQHVLQKVKPSYQHLMERFGFPDQEEFFEPVERKLSTLGAVRFVFAHGDLNGGNILVDKMENGTKMEFCVHSIDQENRFWGPAGLDFAFHLGRNDYTEQEQEKMIELWLQEMPEAYIGNRTQARQDLDVYLQYEMIKSAIIDVVRCQQAAMQGNLTVDQLSTKFQASLNKINQAMDAWGKPRLDELTFREEIERFNQQESEQIVQTIQAYQELHHSGQLTNHEMNTLVDIINQKRILWNQEPNFTRAHIFSIFDENLTSEELITRTVRLPIEEDQLGAEKGPYQFLQLVANREAADILESPVMISESATRPQKTLWTSEQFGPLMVPSLHEQEEMRVQQERGL